MLADTYYSFADEEEIYPLFYAGVHIIQPSFCPSPVAGRTPIIALHKNWPV